jgi:hypothetical protein
VARCKENRISQNRGEIRGEKRRWPVRAKVERWRHPKQRAAVNVATAEVVIDRCPVTGRALSVYLPDGRMAFYQRRADQCMACAVATLLQVHIADVPDPQIDAQLAAGTLPWANDFLPPPDASLYAFLRSRKPRRYYEIGSGRRCSRAARSPTAARRLASCLSTSSRVKKSIIFATRRSGARYRAPTWESSAS